MTRRASGLALAGLQLLLALAVFARLQLDRLTTPRVWVRTVPVDPADPLRGRYLRLWLEVDDRRSAPDLRAEFAVENERLVAHDAAGTGGVLMRAGPGGLTGKAIPDRSIAFFLPEQGPDPSRLQPGEELWVEVSVPHDGLPRPIRIEARRQD